MRLNLWAAVAVTLVAVMVLSGENAMAQPQLYTLDLAKTVNQTKTESVTAGKPFRVVIQNKLHSVRSGYTLSVTVNRNKIKPLVLPQGSQGVIGANSKCKLDSSLTYEEELAEAISRLSPNGCREGMIAHHSDTLGVYVLNNGERLEVALTRNVDDEKRSWVYTFTTEPRGEWEVTYGFSFISPIFSKEGRFHTAAQDSQSYVIRKDHNRRKLDFVPSVFFSWMPANPRSDVWVVGLSGGLGFDTTSPTVFAAATVSYNQNLKVHLGLAAHQQEVLLGKYQEGDHVNEVLDFSQLHEKLYRINPFFSLSLRLSQNPFGKAPGRPATDAASGADPEE